MLLRATLVGHTDVITDLSLSPCGKYIASSGRDGLIIIWDLQEVREIQRLDQHRGYQINNIKFF